MKSFIDVSNYSDNVFNYIFLHTKNIDITFYHSQKSFYYYVEFIEQITEDKNMFLKLSSRDAAMYVYKKTIFEINNESRKFLSEMDTETVNKLYKINEYIHLIKSIVYNVLNNTTFYLLDKIHMNKILLTIENICNRIMKISDLSISEITLFSVLIEKLNIEDTPVDKYVELLELSIKKIEKEYELHIKTDYHISQVDLIKEIRKQRLLSLGNR